MKLALALVLACACSVPPISLDGKQCPCIDVGYTCDKLTNRCLATNDGGVIIDSPAATQCLPQVPETELYRYTGMFDWQHADTSWTGGTEITQTSNNVQNSYTFKTSAELTAAKDVHVISSMRQIQPGTGSPAFGIALRAQLDTQDRSHYACMWSSKARELYIEVSQGGNTSTLKAVPIPGTNTLPTSFTMEASVTGSTLACCIREIAPARLSAVMDTSVIAGYPGVQTQRMEAAFGSFVVLKPN
ncbi:MAG TPA: hypothetical protein VIV40_14595 [Kofleriaceae bacterium]